MTEPQALSTTEVPEGAAGYTQVGTADDVQLVRDLAERRFNERPDATIHGADNTRKLVLTGWEDGLRLSTLPPDEELIISYVNQDQPTCWLKLIDGRLWFYDTGSEVRDFRRLITMLETYPVPLPVMVPYGVVIGDVIVGILFYTEPDLMVIDDEYRMVAGTDVFVLEGWPKPDLLRYTGSPSEFCAHLWRAVGAGQLVPLGGRLNSHSDPVQWIWDGSHGYLEIKNPDDRMPTLAPNGLRYVSWSLGEESPGSDGRAYSDHEPMERELRGWFSE